MNRKTIDDLLYSQLVDDDELVGGMPADDSSGDLELPLQSPDIAEARANRDKEVAMANLAQGITQIGAGLSGQKADTSIYDAARKGAQTKVAETLTDASTRRKAVGDAVRAKLGKTKLVLADQQKKDAEARHDAERKEDKAWREGESEKSRDFMREMQENKPEQLSAPDRAYVTTLETKNANKESIANAIDAVMGQWDKYSDSEKLQQGRQLIKVLNSSEGQDAVGAEESKRLGAKLQFAMGNLTNDNPFQVGRDLKGFAQDANNTAKSLRAAAEANRKLVSDRVGQRTGKAPSQGGGGDGTLSPEKRKRLLELRAKRAKG